MKARTTIIMCVLLFFAACAPSELAGSSDRQAVYFPSLGSNVLDGTNATHANGTTSTLSVGFGTEYAVWVSCEGDIDVDSLSYDVSPGAGIWTSGDVGLAGCDDNTTKYTLTDKGVQRLRFNVGVNTTNTTATGDFTIAVSVK